MILTVEASPKSYKVIIENGILAKLANYLDINKKTIIITDDLIPNEHVSLVSSQLTNCHVYCFNHGELNKNLETWQSILKFMLEKEFDRHSRVIALGGGIVGDLAGFVASSYKRGVEFINLPTTTLAMIDSSIGGKVGVNLEHYKNAVGSFYNPSLVLVDPLVLKTLPKRHFYNGLVEALKMGLILDEELYRLFLQPNFEENLEDIIFYSLMAKKRVVEADPQEQGIRKILNFGHTIGHAVESYYLGDILHGEAVAIGMTFAIDNKTIYAEVKEIFQKMQIRTEVEDEVKKGFLKYIKNDKKRNNEGIDFIVLYDINQVEIVNFSFEEIKKIMGVLK